MGKFVSGLAGLVGGLLLFFLSLPFVGLGSAGAVLSGAGTNSVSAGIAVWIGFVTLITVGAPLYFWLILPLRRAMRR